MSFQLGPLENWLYDLLPEKSLFLLVDPDRTAVQDLLELGKLAADCGVRALLAGTSLMAGSGMAETVTHLKEASGLPVILFPGDAGQVVPQADGILFLSLISGRNPQYLIGEHVRAAPLLAARGVECLPTGYMLVESGTHTSVLFMSGSQPLPRNKPDIAVAHALAARSLGLRELYLEAGSGALQTVPAEMIRAVKQVFPGPLFVGGGLRDAAQVGAAAVAGADVVVVGNRLEGLPLAEQRELLCSMVQALGE